MSLDYWHLSMGTVQLALRNHVFESKPCGESKFKFRVGRDWYSISCAHLPRLFVERELNVSGILGEDIDMNQLFSAMDTINGKYNLVKVTLGEEPPIIVFMLCLHEDRYLNFKSNLLDYIRELDDAIESFCVSVRMLQDEEEEALKEEIDRMWDSKDNPFDRALRNH